jgi:hypothetical protein
VVINSGPYDNRTLIANIFANELWAVRYKARNKNAGYSTASNLTVDIGEYIFDINSGAYSKLNDDEAGIVFT